ncbi:MAG: stage II sporulation protein M [Candidatus Methanomethylicia archaeon]|jgi:stage II sporulation protein M|nr:stage II sporulation protein M [Candidatus Methanomethylicia archaeon]
MEEGRKANNIYKYILISIGLLVIGMALGVLMPKTGTPLSESPLFEILSPYVELYKPYEFSTVLFLFVKNSLTVGLAFFMSPALLIFPIMILVLNGFMTGFIASVLPIDLALKALAPHGIFELPALVLAATGGLCFGTGVIRKIVRRIRGKEYELTRDFRRGLRLFMISLVLLFVAAIMETYVTPFIVGFAP